MGSIRPGQCNICCRIVTVQPKSELLSQACREVEQRYLIVPGGRKSANSRGQACQRAASDRRKKSIKAGINIPPARIRRLNFSKVGFSPAGRNAVQCGPFLMKLAAGRGES
jgi:hypothetical protein